MTIFLLIRQTIQLSIFKQFQSDRSKLKHFDSEWETMLPTLRILMNELSSFRFNISEVKHMVAAKHTCTSNISHWICCLITNLLPMTTY